MSETLNIVDELETWKETPANKNSTCLTHEIIIDIDGMEMLTPFVSGFMTTPVAIINDAPIAAMTKRIDDLQEFKQGIINSNKQVFLYQLHWVPSYPYYKELNPLTNEPTVIVDGPHIRNGFWMVRYAEK